MARILFFQPLGPGNWYDSAWSHRALVAVDNGSSGTLSNYNVKLTLTSSNWDFSTPLTTAADLRATDSTGLVLISHYLASYDHTAQTGVLWVKVPSLSAGGGTFYLYYGNASATSTAVTYDTMFAKFATDANTLALWHCDDGTGTTAADATGIYNLALTNVTWGGSDGGGQDTTQTTFSSGSYLHFNGTSAHANATGLFDTLVPPAMTIEGWIRLTTLPSATATIWCKRTTTSEYLFTYVRTTGFLQLSWYPEIAHLHHTQAIDTTTPLTPGVWYHIAMTSGGGGVRLYLNGVLLIALPTTGALTAGSSQPFILGVDPLGPANWFKGDMDEIRILTIESTSGEIVSDMQRSPRFTAPIVLPDRLTRHATAIITGGSQAWETSGFVEETSVVWYNNQFMAFYGTRRTGFGNLNGIGLSTSPDGLTWTKYASNPVFIGGGLSDVVHAVVQYVPALNALMMIYSPYAEGTADVGDGFYAATSTDGITWTLWPSHPWFAITGTGWETQVGNSSLWLVGSTYYFLYECRNGTTGASLWQMGFATATSLNGPWTKYASNPLTALAMVSGAPFGGPRAGAVIDGTMHLLYTARDLTSTDGVVHVSSTDFITWTKDIYGAVAPMFIASEHDGTLDSGFAEGPNRCVVVFSAENGSAVSVTESATFEGTARQLFAGPLALPTGTIGAGTTR